MRYGLDQAAYFWRRYIFRRRDAQPPKVPTSSAYEAAASSSSGGYASGRLAKEKEKYQHDATARV